MRKVFVSLKMEQSKNERSTKLYLYPLFQFHLFYIVQTWNENEKQNSNRPLYNWHCICRAQRQPQPPHSDAYVSNLIYLISFVYDLSWPLPYRECNLLKLCWISAPQIVFFFSFSIFIIFNLTYEYNYIMSSEQNRCNNAKRRRKNHIIHFIYLYKIKWKWNGITVDLEIRLLRQTLIRIEWNSRISTNRSRYSVRFSSTKNQLWTHTLRHWKIERRTQTN